VARNRRTALGPRLRRGAPGNRAWLVAGALLAATALLGCSNAAAVRPSVPIVGMAGFHTYD
jgi:hypothetical protein